MTGRRHEHVQRETRSANLRSAWSGGARFVPTGHNRKLSPVDQIPTDKRPRLTPRAPFVSLTDVAIAATCSDACAFKRDGCYVRSGGTKGRAAILDRAAQGRTADEVIAEEVGLIEAAFGGGAIPQDGKKGGRDLRLHVGGDVGTVAGARMLAVAADNWRARGGGTVWTFTHWWRDIPRDAFGYISVLASIERPEDVAVANAAGYAAALVVDSFPSSKAFSLTGTEARVVPCPAETRGATCVECRLCLDVDLRRKNVAIAFEAHGPAARRAKQALVQLRLPSRAPQDGATWLPATHRPIITLEKGNRPMFTQTVLIRMLNLGTEITANDPLVRIVGLSVEAAGGRVESTATRTGVRRDKGSYLVLEHTLTAADEAKLGSIIDVVAKNFRSLASLRELDSVRLELELLDRQEGAA